MMRAFTIAFASSGMLAALSCGGGSKGTSPYNPVIDPAAFVAAVDNPFFPLVPGTTFVYRGGTESTEVVVMAETKTILGVVCTVVRDRVFVDGELLEDTYDWYAQDTAGNVWYMGEDTKEYDGGVVVSTAGSFEAGIDGAKPGIIMQAHPVIGQQYRQEYYKGEAEDMAKVLSVTAEAHVPHGHYTHCLQTEEWTPLEPGVREHKYYAEDLGFVLQVAVTGGGGRSELIAKYGPD